MNNKPFYAETNPSKNARFLIMVGVLLLLQATTVIATDKPAIEWELVNPFRFVWDHNSVDKIREAYEELGQKSAYDLERKLQHIADEAVEKNRVAEKENCAKELSKKKRNKCFADARTPYLGWFARLAETNFKKTCWDSSQLRFRNENGCEDYVHPKKHKVRFWISNAHLLRGRTPHWFKNGKEMAEPSCDSKYKKELCIELDIDYDENQINKTTVEFSDNDLRLTTGPFSVEDKLIVGLGDSYASGEGNPDVPATFKNGESDREFFYTFDFTRTPQKDEDSTVAWLDPRCHRSMYSYQFKTALQLALDNPKQAITFVSYSCSGAVTDNIISEPQVANEKIKATSELKKNQQYKRVLPQLIALQQVLTNPETCKQRPIDYLLLSTGGNDIGFVEYVAYIATSGVIKRFAGKVADEKTGGKIKQDIFEKLLGGNGTSGNYAKLHENLLEVLHFRHCPDAKACNRILLTAYPDILNDESGKRCLANRSEFDLTFKPDSGRAQRVGDVRKFVFKPLQELQTMIRDEPKYQTEFGWTVVTGHFDHYNKRGFCAQDCKSRTTGEKFVMPTRNKTWKSFHPGNYKAYEHRQRLVRLPVDSKLTTDQVEYVWKFRLDLFQDETANIMHPTAEGHALSADANLQEIRRLECKSSNRVANRQKPCDGN